MDSPAIGVGLILVVSLIVLALIVIYYVLIVRAILEMLRQDAHVVLLVFAFLALSPLPPFLVMGVMVILIWHFHKGALAAGTGA